MSLQRPSRQDRGGQGAQRTRSATPVAPCRGHACPSSVEGQASPLRSRPRIMTLCPHVVRPLVEAAVRLAYPLETRYPQDEGEKGNNMCARQRNGEI